jgi:hypothetical protein
MPSSHSQRSKPCGLSYPSMPPPVYMHGRSEWSRVLFLRTPLVFHETWVETRVYQDCRRLARNGGSTASAYQRSEVPERCFLRQATRALHFAALAAPETMRPRPGQSARRCCQEVCHSKLNLAHQQCMPAMHSHCCMLCSTLSETNLGILPPE